jgi:iron complex transport system permease protein
MSGDSPKSARFLAGALILALPVVFLLSIGTGAVSVPFEELLRALFAGTSDPLGLVLWELRAPRAVLACLIGAALGLAGAAMQGYLRNPLADPGVLGVSAGAGLGAVLMFYTGAVASFPLALPVGGLAGALLSVILLMVLSGRQATVQTLVLAGLALSSLFGALTSLAISLSPNPWAVGEITLWMLGSLTDRSWSHVFTAGPFLALGALLLLGTGGPLRALSLGEETAASLGVDLSRLRLRIALACALLVGAATAVAGSIGFVGLIVPHLLRPVVKGDPARLLPLSALGGAVLLPLADLAVRHSPSGAELRLGVVTALLGAPIFIAMLVRLGRRSS